MENPCLQFAFLILRLEIENDVWIDPSYAQDDTFQRHHLGHVEVVRIGVMGRRLDARREDHSQHGDSKSGSHEDSSRYRGSVTGLLRPRLSPRAARLLAGLEAIEAFIR